MVTCSSAHDGGVVSWRAEVWESPVLSFVQAAAVWASAVGIANAYYPEEFFTLATIYGDGASPFSLGLLHEEACRRAEWRAMYQDAPANGLPFGRPAGSYIRPRAAEIVNDTLVWDTSVSTQLFACEGGWIVTIVGHHETRQAAAECTLARVQS